MQIITDVLFFFYHLDSLSIFLLFPCDRLSQLLRTHPELALEVQMYFTISQRMTSFAREAFSTPTLVIHYSHLVVRTNTVRVYLSPFSLSSSALFTYFTMHSYIPLRYILCILILSFASACAGKSAQQRLEPSHPRRQLYQTGQ